MAIAAARGRWDQGTQNTWMYMCGVDSEKKREREGVRGRERLMQISANVKKEIVIMLTSKLNFDFRVCLPNTNDNN